MFGGPGSGKTHLSTCIIDHLHGLYGGGQLQSGGVSIAYFYIRENEQQLTDPNTILKTLAWQIAEYDSRFKKHAVKVCSSKQRIISAEQTWNNLFVAFYQSIANIDRSSMLVIDGLDEAPRAARSTLLGFFKRLLSENDDGKQPRIQVAVIGRITLKGDMDFEREEKFIEVSREKNNEDLDRYIEDRLSRIKFMRRLVELDKQEAKKGLQKQTRLRTSKAKDKLKERISKYVDGVFLWAKLLLDQIHHKDGPEIEKILNRPPQTLKGMVKQVYERLSAEEDDLEPIKKLLIWVAYAQRPLLFGEIELILSLPSRAQNILLWEKFQGRLASIFAMKIPEHDVSDENDALEQSRDSGKQVPSEDDEFGTQEEENLRGPSPQAGNSNTEGRNDDLDELGLSSEGDFDGNDHQSDTGEFKLLDDLEIDRGLDVLAAGEHLHAYADWQSKTRITFSHLQFKEFIVHRDQRDPIDLDINVGRSHLEITLTCFEMLQIGFDVQEPSRYLVDYPRRFLTRHLELIDPNAVNENDRYNILQGLYWIFHEERRARSLFNAPTAPGTEEPWEDYWETWLATNTHSKNVRVWLSAGVEMGQRFDEAALTWMKAASMSTKTLFQAWIEALAKMWLVKPGFDDPSYLYKQPNLVWLMYGMASVVNLPLPHLPQQ